MSGTGREQHHCVAQVDDGYSAAVGETPPPSHAGGDRYLTALGNEELRCGSSTKQKRSWRCSLGCTTHTARKIMTTQSSTAVLDVPIEPVVPDELIQRLYVVGS